MGTFKLDKNTEVVCNYGSNGAGFYHTATLYHKEIEYDTIKNQYYNRTRERWTFETVLYSIAWSFVMSSWKSYDKNRHILKKIKSM